jgi:serine/threonine protein kinase
MSDPVPAAKRKVARELFGYRVRRVIGDGAWSRVYEVEDTKAHRALALKHVVSEGEKEDRYVDQLRAEWEIGRKLDHPAIRKLLSFEGEGLLNKLFRAKSNDVGLVMELIDAPPLSDMMRQRMRPSIPECIAIFHDVASGLQHMHDKGFVHADMKPLNILYDRDRRLTKIIDLGQSVKIGTQKKRLQGSPGYISPEQTNEVSDKLYEAVTPATDVFNFGATMYAILAYGKLAPAAQSKSKSVRIAEDELGPTGPLHASDRSIPEKLSMAVVGCLAQKPSDRTPMRKLIETLQSLRS